MSLKTLPKLVKPLVKLSMVDNGAGVITLVTGSLTVSTCSLLQVPRVFIGKDCIGGCNDLIAMQQNGELMTRLKQIGALQ